MKNIYDVLAEKKRQLHLLEREVESLEVAASLLVDEQDKIAASNGSGMSQARMARQVLSDKSKSMHVSEISKAIQKRFSKKLKTAHISALMYRYIKIGKSFYKVDGKPGTFGLKEWQAEKT